VGTGEPEKKGDAALKYEVSAAKLTATIQLGGPPQLTFGWILFMESHSAKSRGRDFAQVTALGIDRWGIGFEPKSGRMNISEMVVKESFFNTITLLNNCAGGWL
jgi:hypothetical protein